jgi:hypothetical protein
MVIGDTIALEGEETGDSAEVEGGELLDEVARAQELDDKLPVSLLWAALFLPKIPKMKRILITLL